MTEEFRRQVYQEFDLKETDDLLAIWQTNDRVEWSEVAFEVIRDILTKRKIEIPPQDEPIREHKPSLSEDHDLEDWEDALLDAKDQPQLYDTLDVLAMRHNIDSVAIAVIVLYVFMGVLSFPFVRELVSGNGFSTFEIRQSIPTMIVTSLNVVLQIVLTYFPLKALAHLLRILMQMEFNSRKAI